MMEVEIIKSKKNSESNREVSINDFEIVKVIGRGTFGKVFLVKDQVSNTYYAMKTLKKSFILRKNQKHNTKGKHYSLSAERKILEIVEHPFIVELHYAFQTPEKLYFVLDYLNGGELFFHLRKDKSFSESRTRFYAA